MAVYDVVLYGDPVLRRRAEAVPEVGPDVAQLLQDMVETMHREPGVGLAAPQVGVSKRLIVVDVSAGEDARKILKLVNPKILLEEGEQTGEEGCLSFPGIFLDVTRPLRVRIEALNEHGWPFCVEGEGFLARALHHEFDHVEGRLFLDRVSLLVRERAKREIKRRQREGEWSPKFAGHRAGAL
jgi:peptide deformylase